MWPRREFLVNANSVNGISGYRDGDYKLVSINGSFLEFSRYIGAGPEQQVHIPTPGGTLPGADANASVNPLDSLMTSSLTWEVLEKLDEGELAVPTGWRQRAAVNCSPENSSPVPGLAELHEGYYLFDLASDPCELNNLAQGTTLGKQTGSKDLWLGNVILVKLHFGRS
ncbi:hypothetical protein HPB48_004154 [Haemaphysalis longicornis]|uniref:Uncharacterized protein n=1 Tax=Haemaphysalis longicornis TaxID=44386 RepID=A0A9J6FMY9_HAELO|nr:hypothetical protein HPB48_004154 [Haemaphysalis longicornis]